MCENSTMLVVALALFVSAQAPAPTPAPPAAPAPSASPPATTAAATAATTKAKSDDEKPRVLVLDLEASGVDPQQVKLINGLVTESMSRFDQYEVISSADVRQLVDVEANKSAAGCDSSSCLAEVAGAMGARWVVFGNVGRLGNLTVLTLSLFDTQKAKAVGRQRLEVKEIETLPTLLDDALANLIGAPKAAPAAAPPGKPLSALFYGGAAAGVVGVVGVVGTGLVAANMDSTLATAKSAPADKQTALDVGPWVLVGAAASTVVAVGGAGLAIASLVME